MHKPGRAEGYNIISPWASEDTSWIVICITIWSWARLLKLLGIIRRFASNWVPIVPSAAVLISIKHITGTPAPDGLAVCLEGKFFGTIGSKVRVTTSSGAVSLPIDGLNRHWHIEAINKANIIEVQCCKCELC